MFILVAVAGRKYCWDHPHTVGSPRSRTDFGFVAKSFVKVKAACDTDTGTQSESDAAPAKVINEVSLREMPTNHTRVTVPVPTKFKFALNAEKKAKY